MPRPKTIKPEEIKEFSDEQLHKALLFVEDVMDRALLPMILAGDTAHSVYTDELYGERLQVATYIDQFNYFSRDILAQYGTMAVIQESNNGTCKAMIHLEHETVPIDIIFVERKQKYYDNPDSVRFRHANYLIPNPIKPYLAELVETF